MDSKQFVDIFEKQFATCDKMLNKTKREEYASDEDVLHNFKQAAHIQQETPREALGGVFAKHVVSIFDMIREENPRDMAVWDEKITDSINYLILLKAIVIEEMKPSSNPPALQSIPANAPSPINPR